jgi:ribosomal protection tetracycline resistance protein
VLGGSAANGAGVDALVAALGEFLPASAGDPDADLSAVVFKIERGASGEKIAYARMFAGTLRTRDVVRGEKVTALAAFADGGAAQRPEVSGREIAKVWGLQDIQIGDTIGNPPPRALQREFPPPTLQSVVVPRSAADGQQLRVALRQLAEQDPLINVRDEPGRELTVSLYGQVQQEVLEATLGHDFGIDSVFGAATPLHVERPLAVGEAVEILHAESNPFNATIGLRVEPARDDSGIEFRLGVDTRDIPLYVYKTRDSFREQMERYVRATLREGLEGWQVVDAIVTMTQCAYSVADGPPSRRGPTSTAADFRKLTPLVLKQALAQSGTVMCEPTVHVSLEVPTRSVGVVLPALARLGAAVEAPAPRAELTTIEAVMPVTSAGELQRHLAALTGGEGVAESTFAGYQPVTSSSSRGSR